LEATTHSLGGQLYGSIALDLPALMFLCRGQAWWDDSAHAKIVADQSSPLRKKTGNGNLELILGDCVIMKKKS